MRECTDIIGGFTIEIIGSGLFISDSHGPFATSNRARLALDF